MTNPDELPPLAVYIHWPFCKSKCPYCDFNSHVRAQVDVDDWRQSLLSELEYMAAQAPRRRVRSLFFGGGTPSLMPPALAQALIDRVQALWPVAGDVEITLEANPTSVEAATFSDFKKAGVNRLSLGVQSLRDRELAFLGREHSAAEALAALERAQLAFDRYSFDLIYARPGQTPGDWEEELAQALRHAGGHLSLYQLTIEENTAFYHAYAKGGFTLPDDEQSEALYRITESMLADKGLLAYEVSNYAVPGEESRHNLAYWEGEDYIGIGPGAHGRIRADGDLSIPAKAGAQREISAASRPPSPEPDSMRAPVGAQRGHKNIRIASQTIKSPERWLESVRKAGHGLELWQATSPQEEAQERIMMGLRLKEGISYDAFERRCGFSLLDHIDRSKQRFYTQQGLLEADPDRLKVTLAGRLLLTRLTAELLR